jgi:hypothetical protein
MKKLFFTFIFCFHIVFIFGQWQEVTVPTPTYGFQYNNPSTFYVLFPYSSLPLANGKIIYSADIYFTPSSGGWGDVFTADDFGNPLSPIAHTAIATPNCACRNIFLGSLNDSTICQFIDNPGYNIYKYGSLSGPIGIGGNIPLSLSMTMKFVYACAYQYVDTLALYRTLVSPAHIQTTFKMPKYRGIRNMMQFVNDSTGYMAVKYKSDTTKNVLLKTNNFGVTWTEVYIDSAKSITAFHFPSLTIGYLANDNGQVFKSTDGGLSWALTSGTSLNYISSIRFVNDNVGYIGGYSGALGKTIDGGNSWSAENSGTSSEIIAFYNFDDVVYFSTISYGRGLFKNSAKIWGLKKDQPVEVPFDIFPNPSGGSVTIGFPPNVSGSLRITDVLGRGIYTTLYDHVSPQTVDMKSFPDGVYLVNLKTDSCSVLKKLVLRKD